MTVRTTRHVLAAIAATALTLVLHAEFVNWLDTAHDPRSWSMPLEVSLSNTASDILSVVAGLALIGVLVTAVIDPSYATMTVVAAVCLVLQGLFQSLLTFTLPPAINTVLGLTVVAFLARALLDWRQVTITRRVPDSPPLAPSSAAASHGAGPH